MKQVIQYVRGHDGITHLKFPNFLVGDLGLYGYPISKTRLCDAIKILLVNCEFFPSINIKTEVDETSRTRRRSVLDIWRHLTNIEEQVNIFETMRAIYKLVEDEELGTSYCSTIERRTFIVSALSELLHIHNHGIEHTEQEDEFGLTFDQWEHIGE
jgi:hypothetical protein